MLAALVLAGCSSDDGGGDAGSNDPLEGLPEVAEGEFVDMTGESEVVVDARDNVFDEPYIEVSPGTKVTFENVGRTAHNVIPSDEGQFEPIEAGDLAPDDTASITVDGPGPVPYYCSLHGTPSAGMVGRIIVVDE